MLLTQKVLFYVAGVLLLLSCSDLPYTLDNKDGVVLIKNSSTNNKKVKNVNLLDSLVVDLTKYSITEPDISKAILSSSNDLYLVDRDYSVSILSLASDSILLKRKFCGRGSAPFEVFLISELFSYNDKLCIVDDYKKSLLLFSLNGEFLESRPLEAEFSQVKSNRDVIYCHHKKFTYSDEGLLRDIKLVKLDNNFSIENIFISRPIHEKKGGTRMYYTELPNMPTALGDKYFYAAEQSKNKYLIKCYNSENNLIQQIEKHFRRVKYSKEELKKIEKNIENLTKATKSKYKLFSSYKDAINSLVEIGENKLLVKASDTPNMMYDFFDKGIFTGRVNFGELGISEDNIKIIGSKLLVYRPIENKLKIYSFDFN